MNKFIIALIALVTSTHAFAENHEWVVINAQHPLWAALDAEPIPQPKFGFLNVEKKTAGTVECIQSTSKSGNTILPGEVQTVCYIPKEIASAEAQAFFSALNTDEQSTKGAYTGIKIIEGLIVVGSNDPEEGSRFARVHYNHACTQVKHLDEARNCMKFWAENVMPSFEEPNTSYAVTSTSAESAVVPFVSSYLNYDDIADRDAKVAEYQSTPFIGMVVSHIYAGRHMTHYAVSNGKNVIPKEIYNENLEDFGWMLDVDEMNETELNDVVKTAVNGLFLGLENPQSIFPGFYDEIIERTEYIGE